MVLCGPLSLRCHTQALIALVVRVSGPRSCSAEQLLRESEPQSRERDRGLFLGLSIAAPVPGAVPIEVCP
jgi:hypothetical protein